MMRAAIAALLLTACAGPAPAPQAADTPDAGLPDAGASGRVALTDLGAATYLGFQGGLYPDGMNEPPAAHLAAGLARAHAIAPLDTSGHPSPSGRIALLSLGMSNTTQEYCSQSSDLPCDAWSFMGQAAADPAVDKSALVLVNGAQGGKSAAFWDSPTDPDYDRIRDTRLAPQGLSENQVQALWIKVANPNPSRSLPDAQSDAYALESQLGNILRAVKVRYPNARLAFLSSRIYAGYAAPGTLNPEPFAYESGFAVKWAIAAQIAQMSGAAPDARAGDVAYDTAAPWVGWGPYLWADGTNARSDGLVWTRADFGPDATHPAQGGREKVGALLLDFFERSQFSRCWFVAGGSCP